MTRDEIVHDAGAPASNSNRLIIRERDASAPSTSTSQMPPPEDKSDQHPLQSAFEKAAKRLRTSTPLAEAVIDQVETQIQHAITTLQSTSADFKAVIADLKSKLDELAPVSKLKRLRKEAERSLDELLNMFDSLFTTNISDTYMESRDFDPNTVKQIVANYLYRQNLVEAGDLFICHAGIPEASTFRSQYKEMHGILEAIRARNLRPAINWATRNRYDLMGNGFDIEYRLHRQQYLEMLKSSHGKSEAINYAQTHISPIYGPFYLQEIKKLLGCILWLDQIDESPYVEFLSQFNFDRLASEFTEQFLALLGQSTACPLSTTVNAGAKNLHLMLMFRKMFNDKEKWGAITYFPFREVEVDRKYSFHTGFVCPECGELETEINPPIMLPCQHVFCFRTIWRWSYFAACWFKCMFCQCDANVYQCKLLNI